MNEERFFMYNGQINVELKENYFKFYPRNGIQQLSVLYDISNPKQKDEKLSMKIKRSNCETSVVTLTLESTNGLLEKLIVLEIHMETPVIMMDTLKEEYQVFKKSLQIFGKYKISRAGKVIKAVFKHNKGIKYAVLVDENTKVYETYKEVCEIWPLRCECSRYCISDKNCVLDEDVTFKDYKYSVKLKFKVAERCDVKPYIGKGREFVMPWNKKSSVLLKYLANLLKLNESDVHLLNSKKEVIRDSLEFDISNFREKDTKDPLSFFYDIKKWKIKCVLMESKKDFLELEVLRDSTTSEIKTKLSEELKIDANRIIVSQIETLLEDDAIVSVDKDVSYCIGSPFADISSEDIIGSGAYAEVFKCVLKSTGNVIALKKFLIPTKDDEKKIRISIIREIKVMTSIPQHENLIRYLDLYINGDEINIGMEFMCNGSLQKYLNPTNPLEEKEIRLFSVDILKGLAHLHYHKVIHRDIKGANVLLGVNKIAKLCDFGISRIITGSESNRTKVLGTFNFMAPEVIVGLKYDFKADIWSFGATLVEMLTGLSPFHNRNKEFIIKTIGTDKKIEFKAKMSTDLNNFVYSCLEPEPNARPTALELLNSDFIYNC